MTEKFNCADSRLVNLCEKGLFIVVPFAHYNQPEVRIAPTTIDTEF
jgi:hypothetical protein